MVSAATVEREEGDRLVLELADQLEELGSLGRNGARALRYLLGRLDAQERRLHTLELAVQAVARRLPEQSPGPTKLLFGIPVAVAPDVDDDAIRAACAELPAGLDGDQVVAKLEEQGLVARKKPRR